MMCSKCTCFQQRYKVNAAVGQVLCQRTFADLEGPKSSTSVRMSQYQSLSKHSQTRGGLVAGER